VERARPLLGTTVAIRVSGLPREEADRAIARGFAAIAEVHRLMSFHDAASDLSRLNRGASRAPVAVDRRTLTVLRHALAAAEASRGLFDPTVGGALAARGVLPRPADAPEPDPAATWRDVTIAGSRVRFGRPLWLDFGGIAKGHAVDAALAAMALPATAQAVVNAGGDLRVAGLAPELVQLGLDVPGGVPLVELADGALASSTGARRWGAAAPVHLGGAHGRPVGKRRFAAVAAPCCMTADWLTKPVLALGSRAVPLLRRFQAIAWLYSARGGWRVLGGD